MSKQLVLKNNIREFRKHKNITQSDFAELVGVSRTTISAIETGMFGPTAKLAYIICIALEKQFEEVFYFE